MVRAFIREQGFPSVILIGHSLGGGVALRACMQMQSEGDPFTVEKLVLIDCAAYPQRLPKFFRRLKTPLLGPLLIRLIPVRVMVRKTLSQVFCDASAATPERFERYARYFRGKGIPYAMRATVKCIDPGGICPLSARDTVNIGVPALIIWGEEDRIIKLKYGSRLHEDLTNSQPEDHSRSAATTPTKSAQRRLSPPWRHSSPRKTISGSEDDKEFCRHPLSFFSRISLTSAGFAFPLLARIT